MREILYSSPAPFSEIPENKKYLDGMIAFFERRNRLLYSNIFLRPFHITIKDYINYFRYCKGLRTLAHDLICNKIELNDIQP